MRQHRRVFKAAFSVLNAAALLLAGSAVVVSILLPKTVNAQSCLSTVGLVASVQGELAISGLPAQSGLGFCSGEQLQVGPQSRVAIHLASTQTTVRINQNSTVVVEQSDSGGVLLKLLKGVVFLFSRRPQSQIVETPYVNAAIEGTEFVVESSEEGSEITVIEGSVLVSNEFGDTRITPGEVAYAGVDTGAPVRRTEVDPLDAVKWALYFPPVGNLEKTTDVVRTAAELLRRGDVDRAEAMLADATEHEDAALLALRSLIAVTRNQPDDAMQLAHRAISLDSENSLAYSAMSYAQQAAFDLNAAWQNALLSVQLDDKNAFALSRLAEMNISRGYYQQALRNAKRAVSINADYSRHHSMIGFTYLNTRDYSAARTAFEKAIALDNSDPVPHLGLGLVMFKTNRIMDGRRLIETAVSLDPLNSLYRSYLGKAYFEEQYYVFADQQFELAKQFDKNDPTPWYLYAISAFSSTTSVQKLENLNKAISLNDNRAIYRSRFMLDSDLATRGVNVANLYQRLGANKQAVIEATHSLGVDPSNYSAHRFLANAYARQPRHEVARVSELLQSQLLNPLNTDPIIARNSFLYTDSALESGASIKPGLYEFSSVFERNGPGLRAAFEAGEREVFNGDIAGSMLWDNAIASASVSSQHSHGYRPNNDASSEVQNVFTQWTPNNRVSFQAEFRHRSSRLGDLSQQFDLDTFSTDLRRNINSDIYRVGLNLEIEPGSNLIASGVSSHIHTLFSDIALVPGLPPLDVRNDVEVDAQQVELQHIVTRAPFSMITGVGRVESESNSTERLSIGDDVLPDQIVEEDRTENTAYLYMSPHLSDDLNMTLGAAYSEQDINNETERLAQPKLGLTWRFTEKARLRLAYFKILKRFLVADQSIEPTQVAGFNQLFDDTDGTRSERTGAALDLKISDSITLNLEASQRTTDFIIDENVNERREKTLSASFFWAVNKRLALAADVALDHFENLSPLENAVNSVTKLSTVRAPLTLTYQLNNSASLGVTGLYLHQDLNRVEFSELPSGSTQTVLLNVSLGYSLLNNKAQISLSAHNITDTQFRYQDERFRSAQVSHTTELIPERRLALQATYRIN